MNILKKTLDIIPSALASRAFGAIADHEFPAVIQSKINRAFAAAAHLNMDEALIPADAFSSLNKLFTRHLKPDARPIASDDLISPVDGTVSFSGPLHDGILLEAKGHSYSVAKLVAEPADAIPDWISNAFAITIYLSPSNYHRIHAPVSGAITRMTYAPGRLLPVNRIGYFISDDLLPANERLTTFFNARDNNHCALVKVGATCVGKISLSFDAFKTNQSFFRNPFAQNLDSQWNVSAGDEIACFELGSTVVLLIENNNFVPSPKLTPGSKISMGMPLGNWNSTP